MANPDIPAALVVLRTHLVAAGATLPDPHEDVERGILTGGKQIRFYWSGETDPPGFGDGQARGSGWELVGQRFTILASWPLSNLSVELATAIDVEMELLAGQIRTRLDGDSDLGNHIDNSLLHHVQQDIVVIGNARFVVLEWTFDLAYLEYVITK